MARSKARKGRRASAASPGKLRKRTAEALAHGSFRKARELARALYKKDATAEHRGYLIEATVGRAAQLRQAGQTAEAVDMLRTVVEGEFVSSELLVQCINELMLAGDWKTAEILTGRIADADVLHRLEVLRADTAVLHGEPGLAHLQEDVRPAAQSVLRALAQLEQGNDAAVHETVAGIPNDSPLYDWKLLMQGLTAFYAGELAALEIWQQLEPGRAPASIAVPLRAQIDPAFLASQPQQAQLVAFGRRLCAEDWLDALEDVQRLLAREDLSAALLRAAEALEEIPAEHQELRQRLARTMYWQVVQLGDDEDVDDYASLFDAPSDDRSLHRLRALHHEQAKEAAEAQDYWASYEQDLTQSNIFSAEDRELARSLVWFRMGELAVQGDPTMPAGFPFRPDFNDEDECAFETVECLRRSVKLAPQNLEAHESLIALLHIAEKQREVVRAAGNLLQHFPEHQRALEVLADDAFRHNCWDEAQALQTRAVKARPHDTNLVARLDFYELGLARLRAQEGRFDEARAILAAQLEKETTANRCNILCRQAAVELKAGRQQRGEELFERACEVATSRLVAVFEMLIESIRMPVDSKWIQKIDREFRRGLRAKVDGPSAMVMLKTLPAFASTKVSYDGLQEHQKLILQYLKRARNVAFSEEEMQSICACLQELPTNKLWLDFATRGSREFPQQPAFPFAVASYYLALGPEKCPLPKADEALHTALDLAQDNPAYAVLMPQIEAALAVVHRAMFMGSFGDHDDQDEPLSLDILDAMANLFGISFDDADEPDDAPRRGPRRDGHKRPGHSRRKRLL
jgi:tetratricopeptide (TPR) repeat protein